MFSSNIPIKSTQINNPVSVSLYNRPAKNSLCILGPSAKSQNVWIRAICFMTRTQKLFITVAVYYAAMKLFPSQRCVWNVPPAVVIKSFEVPDFLSQPENLHNKDGTSVRKWQETLLRFRVTHTFVIGRELKIETNWKVCNLHSNLQGMKKNEAKNHASSLIRLCSGTDVLSAKCYFLHANMPSMIRSCCLTGTKVIIFCIFAC